MIEQLPWTYIAISIGVFLVIGLLQRIPVIGGVIRGLISIALIGAVVLLLTERAPFDPLLARLSDRLNLSGQQVTGGETRIRLGPNGHFVANVQLNGVSKRMLVDSGATITALSAKSAAEVGLRLNDDLVPVIIQTANGAVRARTATVPELRIGNIVARDLKVVVSPAFGSVDVIGMNLLSKLKGWRVENSTLILVPNNPQPAAAD
jgi:aspartyl protease family protein